MPDVGAGDVGCPGGFGFVKAVALQSRAGLKVKH